MAPVTPVTMTSPTGPATYAWEATDEEVAERCGIPLERVIRFDLNTSPYPPELASRILAAGRFDRPISEYPPSDYRRLVASAADVYGVPADEIVVGAGADEILDMCGKAFLPPGGTAVVPTPSYAMYRVITEQRGGRVVAVPRLGPDEGYAIDVPATRAAARGADLVWLCSPNNPTALPEPDGAIETLLSGLAADAAADRRTPAAVVLDEAYAEFVGRSLLPLREVFPRLVVVRTASKAYGLAGLRVGFAIARRPALAELEIYRPPGSVAVTSVAVVTEVLRDREALEGNIERIEAERFRLASAFAEVGWPAGPSVTNFLLVNLGNAERAERVANGLLERGLVPRTFGAGHPLADHLRITVRSPAEDDRLIEALPELAAREATT